MKNRNKILTFVFIIFLFLLIISYININKNNIEIKKIKELKKFDSIIINKKNNDKINIKMIDGKNDYLDPYNKPKNPVHFDHQSYIIKDYKNFKVFDLQFDIPVVISHHNSFNIIENINPYNSQIHISSNFSNDIQLFNPHLVILMPPENQNFPTDHFFYNFSSIVLVKIPKNASNNLKNEFIKNHFKLIKTDSDNIYYENYIYTGGRIHLYPR